MRGKVANKPFPKPMLVRCPGPVSQCKNARAVLCKGQVREIAGIRSRFSRVAWRRRRAVRAPTTEAGLPPRDVHALPGTGVGVVGHRVAQAVLAVGAGADIVVTVLQVGQRGHCVVAGFEFGGRQKSASLLRELGCGGGKGRAGEPGLARALPQPGCCDPRGQCRLLL